MRCNWVICVLFILLIDSSLSRLAVADEDQPAIAPGLSSTMNWDQIHGAMEAYPPTYENGDQRRLIMLSMDRLIDFSVKHISEEDRAKVKPRLSEMVRFYRRRVDRGLDVLEKTRVRTGVHVFKFYSSSVVLKSAAGTVAVDFCQGPVNNGKEPELADLYESGFYLTPEQRDRLARLVDVALITHRHHDHADYSLAKRMVAMGKPVVGPMQLAQQWPDLAHGLTVPTYDHLQRVGPCSILTQFGYQYATSREGDDGQRVGEHEAGHPERSSETVRYLVQIGGITILQSAESQTEAHRWLAEAYGRGWQVDVLLSPGQYQGARSVMEFLQDREYLRIPIHEYELMHYGGGNRTGQLLDGSGRASFDRQRSMPLLWGEDFRLRKQ